MERTIYINGQEQIATYNMRTGKIYRELCKGDLIKDAEVVKGKMFLRMLKPHENDDMVAYAIILSEVAGQEFLERIFYSCMRTTAEMEKKRFMTIEKFVDQFEDPNEFYACAYSIFDLITFGNSQTVEAEKTEESTKEDKKKE